MISFLFYSNIVLFILTCLILILLVLVQKGRGGGLSGAFGGGGGGSTAFGAKTGDVLTWVTSGAFAAFVVLAVTLNLLTNYRHDHVSNGLTPSFVVPTAPAAGPTPRTSRAVESTTQRAP